MWVANRLKVLTAGKSVTITASSGGITRAKVLRVTKS